MISISLLLLSYLSYRIDRIVYALTRLVIHTRDLLLNCFVENYSIISLNTPLRQNPTVMRCSVTGISTFFDIASIVQLRRPATLSTCGLDQCFLTWVPRRSLEGSAKMLCCVFIKILKIEKS